MSATKTKNSGTAMHDLQAYDLFQLTPFLSVGVCNKILVIFIFC